MTDARPGAPGARPARRASLVVGAFVVLIVALARPQATIAVPRLEGTLMLTFDVSASMAADDADPSRLEAAKATAREIVARRPPGVVIGVVAFSNAGIDGPGADPGHRRGAHRDRPAGADRGHVARGRDRVHARGDRGVAGRHAGRLLLEPLAGADRGADAGRARLGRRRP